MGMALALREASAAASDPAADDGGSRHTRAPTLLGDAISLANGGAFAGFIVLSRHLRTTVGMPLFAFQARCPCACCVPLTVTAPVCAPRA